jgi:SAM-dependent methyltransferase
LARDPTAADFDRQFAAVPSSPGIRRVWQAVDPDLPAEVEPCSFVSVALLRHVANALVLLPGQTLVDLGCGRGGPGLWLARSLGVTLVGVDLSAVAVQHATDRAALFGLDATARFLIGDLAATGQPDGSADAVVCIDAFAMAADLEAAGREVVRILRPGQRLVLTGWRPLHPGDVRLPASLRLDLAAVLRHAGLAGVEVESRAEWHDLFTGVYRAALDLGDPGDDAALAALQDEARRALPLAGLLDRVVITAIAPDGQPAARQEPFTTGSHRGLFEGPPTVRPGGHLVVLSVRESPPPCGTTAATRPGR